VQLESQAASARDEALLSIGETTAAVQDQAAAMRDLQTASVPASFDTFGDDLLDQFDAVSRGARDMQSAFEGAFDTLISRGGTVKDFLGSLAQDLSRSALRSITGDLFKGIKLFASGGIVGQPTLFDTRVGLAGEAGPEAIIPMRRGPGGLGLRGPVGPRPVPRGPGVRGRAPGAHCDVRGPG